MELFLNFFLQYISSTSHNSMRIMRLVVAAETHVAGAGFDQGVKLKVNYPLLFNRYLKLHVLLIQRIFICHWQRIVNRSVIFARRYQ